MQAEVLQKAKLWDNISREVDMLVNYSKKVMQHFKNKTLSNFLWIRATLSAQCSGFSIRFIFYMIWFICLERIQYMQADEVRSSAQKFMLE